MTLRSLKWPYDSKKKTTTSIPQRHSCGNWNWKVFHCSRCANGFLMPSQDAEWSSILYIWWIPTASGHRQNGKSWPVPLCFDSCLSTGPGNDIVLFMFWISPSKINFTLLAASSGPIYHQHNCCEKLLANFVGPYSLRIRCPSISGWVTTGVIWELPCHERKLSYS